MFDRIFPLPTLIPSFPRRNRHRSHRQDRRASLVPVLTFEAGDTSRHVLPQGSYGGAVDILRFFGCGRRDVANVRMAVRSTTTARIDAGPREVTTRALDSHRLSRWLATPTSRQ
ncbi:hypothetical protein ACWEQ2_27980 [Streptomyces sp. NPDC004096]